LTAVRLLIAWCHGGNWGHVARQLALARHAQAAGFEVVWAVPPRQATAMAAVRARGHRVLVSPDLEESLPNMRSMPRSYADILLRLGFNDATRLRSQTAAWLRLFAELQPELVAIDYAPAAQLAAQVATLPALQLTNGFDSPPADCPPYEATLRGPYLQRQAAADVERVQRTLHGVAKALSPSAHNTSLRSLIEYPHRLMDCVPESDPYATLRDPAGTGIDYIGPLGDAPGAAAPSWPEGAPGVPRVFAYLRGAHSHFELALAQLRKHAAAVLCVWPDAPESVLAEVASHPRLRIQRQPVLATAALQHADAVLSYGSSTFACQALLAGKPQLMLPADHEKLLVARQVARSGLGLLAEEGVPDSHIRQCVSDLLQDTRIADRTRQAALRYGALSEHAHAAVRNALNRAVTRSR
jgi:UDP:flavonoid glycosyltransferase YjiC (YdhE family)